MEKRNVKGEGMLDKADVLCLSTQQGTKNAKFKVLSKRRVKFRRSIFAVRASVDRNQRVSMLNVAKFPEPVGGGQGDDFRTTPLGSG